MKPFNLERALAGDPVVTRDGRKVLQVVHFPQMRLEKRVMALIEGNGIPGGYNENGRLFKEDTSDADMFMVATTKKYYVAVEKITTGNQDIKCCSHAYVSKNKVEEIFDKDEFHIVEVEIEE